jgi:hypothetical protein
MDVGIMRWLYQHDGCTSVLPAMQALSFNNHQHHRLLNGCAVPLDANISWGKTVDS